MSELDAITIHNPTSEDFTHNYNGEPYTVEANSTKAFAQFVGYHLAKHLASQMVMDSFSEKEKKDQKKAIVISQNLSYDNPRLRIALYKIFQNKDSVQNTIMAYPYKGFIGDMKEYEDFVNKEEEKNKTKSEEKKGESEISEGDKK